jgi:hypothetical protein
VLQSRVPTLWRVTTRRWDFSRWTGAYVGVLSSR